LIFVLIELMYDIFIYIL